MLLAFQNTWLTLLWWMDEWSISVLRGLYYFWGSGLALKTGNEITHSNRDRHEGWQLHIQWCLYNHCVGTSHLEASGEDWGWHYEQSNANKSDIDGKLEEERPRVKPHSSAFESRAQGVKCLARGRLGSCGQKCSGPFTVGCRWESFLLPGAPGGLRCLSGKQSQEQNSVLCLSV